MTLRDKFYLRFFLFHQRYGRMLAALLEGVCIFVAAAAIGLALFSLANIAVLGFDYIVEQQTQERVKEVHAEKVKYERIITTCLNGGLIYLDGKARPCSI